jgi:hypothetical protein
MVITVPAKSGVGEIDGILVLAGGCGVPAGKPVGGHSTLSFMTISGSAWLCETAKTAGTKRKSVQNRQKANNGFTVYLISYTIIYLSGKYNNFVNFSLAIYRKCVIIFLKENE